MFGFQHLFDGLGQITPHSFPETRLYDIQLRRQNDPDSSLRQEIYVFPFGYEIDYVFALQGIPQQRLKGFQRRGRAFFR